MNKSSKFFQSSSECILIENRLKIWINLFNSLELIFLWVTNPLINSSCSSPLHFSGEVVFSVLLNGNLSSSHISITPECSTQLALNILLALAFLTLPPGLLYFFHLWVWKHFLHISLNGHPLFKTCYPHTSSPPLSVCFLLFISLLHCCPSPTHILQASSTLTHPPLICTWEPC